jgi:hypothetical protein
MTLHAKATEISYTMVRVTEFGVYSPDYSPQTTSYLYRVIALLITFM